MKMATGVYPFRCAQCGHRFWASIWMMSMLRYAKCPKCLQLELTTWPRRSYHVGFWRKLLITFGAGRHRCSRCRCNFVSFRPRAPQPVLDLDLAADADLHRESEKGHSHESPPAQTSPPESAAANEITPQNLY